MSYVTDAIANPNNVAGRGYDMPTVWPVKYTPEVVVRDLSITYDSSNGGQDDQGTWSQTCQETAAGIATLSDILIETISKSKNSNTDHTATITQTFPYNFNT